LLRRQPVRWRRFGGLRTDQEQEIRPRAKHVRRVFIEEKKGHDGEEREEYETRSAHRTTFRSRSALAMTDTELKVIAALATMGLSSKPSAGYSTPAAIGTPSAL
jgi:hypothetical protein